MRRRLPSTAAMAAFESAARHQSFTKAADELLVTQSAVCRQVAALEDFLGLKLFRRTRRGVTLTEAGASYSAQVSARLDDIERDTFDLISKDGQGGSLELGVVPTFATKWLLPRLAQFRSEFPAITVNLNARTRPFLFDGTSLDAAIHAGSATWPGTEGLFLMQESLIAVCSPGLVAASPAMTAQDLARLPLLQQSTRPAVWRQWFASLDMRFERDHVGARFELFSMLIEAAIQGLGVALIPRLLIEDELRRGLLVQAIDHEHTSDRAYFLINPIRNSENRVLRQFRDWIDAQATAYRNPR
jgi:DNA-binding transcriptional LysR family regulator